MKKSAKRTKRQPLSLQEISERHGHKAIEPDEWELRLYVAGQSPRSLAAFSNLKKICEEHLSGPVQH